MPKYATGKHSKAISDRSGLEFPYREMVREWNGSLVHFTEFEPKQPQLQPRPSGADAISLRHVRPDRIEPATERLLNKDPFTTAAADSGTTEITVKENSHGRSTSDRVRFRNCVGFDGITSANFELAEGYVITKTTDDAYTITVSASSTTGSKTGGGVFVTVGPVSLEA